MRVLSLFALDRHGVLCGGVLFQRQRERLVWKRGAPCCVVFAVQVWAGIVMETGERSFL